MKISFQHFKTFTDITQTATREVDIRRDFADIMYKNANGIEAHDLALRIYRSEGEMELSQREVEIVKSLAAQATPIFYDSLMANIKE